MVLPEYQEPLLEFVGGDMSSPVRKAPSMITAAETLTGPIRQWEFQHSLAFWSAIFYIQGSVLFTFGSLCLFPGMLGEPGLAWKTRGCVDYVFLIGAWAFALANYLLWFSIINQTWGRGQPWAFVLPSRCLRDDGTVWQGRCAWLLDREWDAGVVGQLCNCVGGALFVVNTMAFLGIDRSTTAAYNFWYVTTGGVGSLFFAAAACFEGEHNDWRAVIMRGARHVVADAAVSMALLNLLGGVLFAVAYFADTDRTVTDATARGSSGPLIWGVAAPFSVGSAVFIASSWLSLYMWKLQNYGMGFAKELSRNSLLKNVDTKQQLMLVVYQANICMAWVRLALIFAASGQHDIDEHTPRTEVALRTAFELLTYHCVLLLMSAVHATPTVRPYNYCLWLMRLTAVYGTATQIYALRTQLNSPAASALV
eukprot:g3126.t1